MINVRAQELDAILEVLNKELHAHDHWCNRLHRTLVCRLAPEPGDLAEDAHRHCDFGKWFYSPNNAYLRQLTGFKKIERLHEAMHTQARELCGIVKSNWLITPNEYDPFLRAMQQFREELYAVRDRVSETLHKIDTLTGVFRGSQLLPYLEAMRQQQTEQGKAYSLLRLQFDLCDINERHCWEAGDKILRTCLGKIKTTLSEHDRIYRLAGANFIVCLPGISPTGAEPIKDKLLAAIDEAAQRSLRISTALADTGPPAATADDERLPMKARKANPRTPRAIKMDDDEAAAQSLLTVRYAILAPDSKTDIAGLIKQATLTAHYVKP